MAGSNYPGGLDNFATDRWLGVGDADHGAELQRLSDAVNKIETELGLLPKGAYADVATRLNGSSQPSVSTVALLGTSITNLNGTISGDDGAGNYLRDARGYWNWANILLGQRFTLVAQKGVGGDTSTQMLSRLSTDILALAPTLGWCVLELFVNDIGTTATPNTATSIANATSIINQLLAAGIRPVLCTATP